MPSIFARNKRQTPHVRRLDQAQFEALLPDAIEIYAQAMSYPKAVIPMRVSIARKHLEHPDFYAVGAFLRTRLVGFGYGYRCSPGQWWYDHVQQMLAASDPTTVQAWTSDAFELCELHVAPTYQGAGTGRQLLGHILTESAGATVLLSTPEGESTAHHLYRNAGFGRIASAVTFPGDDRPFAILGLRRTDAST
ncbi:acetyltransferase (GNAT) family protein [Antricoccus suffuscus]|uniref:Acetyltransferase (GNAT) family protein n=1 Tax=Antricoccus suffuscus TaxID=1629062 RepID=A0A2T0ZYS2_9ACTN|nr:GNAT family N-acetyltransferase [Antricoccus suffuscus]PRZ41397.1 acetyltransferase (GNAT) family protein [Antricoccus suffuscus]